MKVKKIAGVTVAVAVAITGYLYANESSAKAQPTDCTGRYSIGIGGMGDSLSMTFRVLGPTDEPVVYSSVAFPHTAVDEFDAAYNRQRTKCPEDWITGIGHSGGALALRRWAEQHYDAEQVNLVLLADPAQPMSGMLCDPPLDALPWPRGGGCGQPTGTVPVLNVCANIDPACNWAPIENKAAFVATFGLTHVAPYDYRPSSYGTHESGQRWV